MSAISDSSQEASNAVPSPNIFLLNETSEGQGSSSFHTPDILKTNRLVIDQSQKRRSSSRSIKRKKFDDELVESSLIKSSSRSRPSNVFPFPPSLGGVTSPSIQSTLSLSLPSSSQAFSEAFPSLSFIKKKSRPPPKRSKKPKVNQPKLECNVSRWKPVDDLTLTLNVIQTNDLEKVHRGVKFSSSFLLREVQERWYALLYDTNISKPAMYAIKQLSPEIISEVQSKVLYCLEEEKLIAAMASDKGSVETFQELLEGNLSVFLPGRTAKELHAHWTMMKQYNLLKDQSGQQPLPAEKDLVTFSDTEEMMDDPNLLLPKDEAINEETAGVSSRHLTEIKQLENEIPRWQVLVENVTGVSIPDFDSKTLAVLKGRTVRYLIQCREVSIGRNCAESRVDVDLNLEGPAWKVSRKQGSIKLDNLGEFHITNEGKRPITVDGKQVMSGSQYKLTNNSVVEITLLRFLFIINLEAVAALKAKYNAS